MGDLLRDAGYYTAYKGKWHLTKEFETVNTLADPSRIFTKEMEAYGFSDYFGIGDIIAHTQGGAPARRRHRRHGREAWLRGKGRALAADGKPWFLAVNLANPHDVMFYDTDAPGERRFGRSAAWRSWRATRSIRSTRRSGSSRFRRATSSASMHPGARRRITTSFARTMRWPARSRTRKPAGVGDTTTT